MAIAEIILAILGSNAITAIVTAWLGRRKTTADANHTIVDSASDVLAMSKSAYEARVAHLEAEIIEVKKQNYDLGERLTKSETRNTGVESRLADAETQAQRLRQSIVFIGEGRDQDRIKARAMVTKLVGVIEHLLMCFEQPDDDKIVDRIAITQLISEILADYPAERFVRV